MMTYTQKKTQCNALGFFIKRKLNRSYVFSLWTFLTLSNFHSYLLAFGWGLTAATVNGAKVNKYVFARLLFNEAETFFVVEPFNGALNYISHVAFFPKVLLTKLA